MLRVPLSAPGRWVILEDMVLALQEVTSGGRVCQHQLSLDPEGSAGYRPISEPSQAPPLADSGNMTDELAHTKETEAAGCWGKEEL